MSAPKRWLLGAGLVGLIACQNSAAKPPQTKTPEAWRAVIRGQPIARIIDVDSARAKRMLDSLAPFATTNKVALAGITAALYAHPNKQIGNSAAYLLAHSGSVGLDVLLGALGSDQQAAQLRAAYGVGEFGVGARNAARRLAFLVRSDSESVARMASWALSVVAPRFKDKSVDLLRRLRFERGYAQHQAAYQVGWLGPSAGFAYPFLVQMLADTSDATRQVATEALQRAGTYARVELEKARMSRNERVRIQAMMILNGLGSE